MDDSDRLGPILRDCLRDFLDEDLQRRLDRPAGTPVYGYWWAPGDPGTAAEADLEAIRQSRSSLADDLATNSPKEMEEYAEELLRNHNLPGHLLRPLTLGLIEAAIQGWDVAEQRTLGHAPLVFEPATALSSPPVSASASPPLPSAPLASLLLDAFGAWGRESAGWKASVENQAKVSATLFVEVCGDKPINAYTRADGDLFRSTVRKLPRAYRKSPSDRTKSLADIVTVADATGSKRISEKTVKRHFWGVSRLFTFLVETGRLPRDFDNPGRGFSFNTKGAVRNQRDMWSGAELRTLFASPVWTGCHPYFRTRKGDNIIRDARFWLPILGLFHGNRLEELAQLRREDVLIADAIPYLHITDEDDRQLKNEQSRRDVPLHPELLRLGFLDYVSEVAPKGPDRVFPELKPGGLDRKFGFYFSKWFTRYRSTVGVRREGLDFHSFRHGVTTKLFAADVNPGWVDLLTGHESGSESQRRYLKGIPLGQLRGAIDRVTWPEVDLSRLYVRPPGDEGWPS